LGYDWNRAPSLSQQGADFDSSSMANSWNYGGGIGWYLAPNWRIDVTAEHHNEANVSGTINSASFSGTDQFGVSSTVVLANLYYDFAGRAGFNPYLGVGIGWAGNHTGGGSATDLCGCVSTIDDASQDNFAWALMAGFTRDLDRGFSLDVGYRLLDVGGAHTGNVIDKTGVAIDGSSVSTSAIYSNEIRIGLRYDIQ
jgi:opacity protein-like surface antigen